MGLSLKEKQKFKKYVIDILIEKFNYQKEIAEELVSKSGVIEKFENNLENEPESVMHFDPQFLAEKLVSRNKK